MRLKRREKGTMDETEGKGGKEHQLAVYFCGDHAWESYQKDRLTSGIQVMDGYGSCIRLLSTKISKTSGLSFKYIQIQS